MNDDLTVFRPPRCFRLFGRHAHAEAPILYVFAQDPADYARDSRPVQPASP